MGTSALIGCGVGWGFEEVWLGDVVLGVVSLFCCVSMCVFSFGFCCIKLDSVEFLGVFIL